MKSFDLKPVKKAKSALSNARKILQQYGDHRFVMPIAGFGTLLVIFLFISMLFSSIEHSKVVSSAKTKDIQDKKISTNDLVIPNKIKQLTLSQAEITQMLLEANQTSFNIPKALRNMQNLNYVKDMSQAGEHFNKTGTLLSEITTIINSLGPQLLQENYQLSFASLISSLTPFLSLISEKIDSAQAEFLDAQKQIEQIPDSILKEYSYNFVRLKKESEAISGSLSEVKNLADLLPSIFGGKTPRTYIILIIDNSIARPGGGVIKGYIRLIFSNGNVFLEPVDDLSKINKRLREIQYDYPLEGNYLNALNPYNLERFLSIADFSISAKNISKVFSSIDEPVDGVIGITQTFFKEALQAIGPITIFDTEIVSSVNIADLFMVNSKISLSLFIDKFLSNLSLLSAERRSLLLSVLLKNIRNKDIIFNFNNEQEQQFLKNYDFSGEFNISNSDSIFIDDVNTLNNHTSSDVKSSLLKTIMIRSNGQVIISLKLTRDHEGISGVNKNYTEFWVPAGSTLISYSGFGGIRETKEVFSSDDVFGKTVFRGWTSLKPGQKKIFKLVYSLPSRIKLTTFESLFTSIIHTQVGMSPLDTVVVIKQDNGVIVNSILPAPQDSRSGVISKSVDNSFEISFRVKKE